MANPTHYRRAKPIEPPPAYTAAAQPADWRSTGPVAQVLAMPEREAPKPQHRLEVNQRPINDLKRLIDLIGTHRVQRELNVHRTTVRRWLQGTVAIPGAQRLAVQALLGNLPGTCGKWTGWWFHEGDLLSPAGDRFSAGQVLSTVFLRQQVSAQQHEIAALKVQLALAEQSINQLSPAANDARAVG